MEKLTNKKEVSIKLQEVELDALLFSMQPVMDEIQTKGHSAYFPPNLKSEFALIVMHVVNKLCMAHNEIKNQ